MTTTAPNWGADWTTTASEAKECPNHGGYESHRMQHRHPLNKPFWTNCPKCNANWEREAAEHDAAILGGLTAKQRAIVARLASLNVPARHTDSTVWNWQHGMPAQKRIWDIVRSYCAEFETVVATGRCLVFYGVTGCGKTHLAIGVLKHIAEKGGSGYYTTLMDMLGRIKSTYSKDSEETEQQVIRMLTQVDMLVIDEIGRNIDSSYEVAQLFRLIDNRHRNLKPMVLVSNLTKDELQKFLGDATWDRLRESGGTAMMFNWASYRGRKKADDNA